MQLWALGQRYGGGGSRLDEGIRHTDEGASSTPNKDEKQGDEIEDDEEDADAIKTIVEIHETNSKNLKAIKDSKTRKKTMKEAEKIQILPTIIEGGSAEKH